MKYDVAAPYDCTFSNEFACKTDGQNDGHMAVDMLKHGVGAVREDDIASQIERSCEENYRYGNSPDRHCYADNEVSIKDSQNESKLVEASYSLPAAKIGQDRKETDFCTEKSVTEVGLPEMILCIKDGACHTVKDICVDDGSHSLKKVFVESNEGEKLSSGLNHSVSNGNYSLTNGKTANTKETSDNLETVSNSMKSSSIIELPMSVTDDGAVKCSDGKSLTDQGKSDTEAPPEAIIEEQLIPLHQFCTDSWKVDSSSFNCMNDQEQSIVLQNNDQGFIGELQGTFQEENTTVNIVPVSADEAIQGNVPKESPFDSQVGVITSHFDSGVATISGSKESKGNTDQQSGQVPYIPKAEDVRFDGAKPSAGSSFFHNGHGDSNFFGPASLSGPIASSGHIQYSGSISLRSDSSTTSAHSFAFPILQSEWNSSPIKMAKADRRRLRRHGSWKMVLLCCRF